LVLADHRFLADPILRPAKEPPLHHEFNRAWGIPQFASHYGYDADDNRTTYTNTQGTISPTYDAQDRLLTYGSASFGYTADGELASRTDSSGTTTYTYDALGNLLSVGLSAGTTIGYVVDGENRRVGRLVNGTLSEGLLYKDAINVVAQLDGSGNLAARFVFGAKPNVPDYFTSSAGTFRILRDHLGSPRLIVNVSTGGVVEEIDYDEFGNVTSDTSPGLTPFGFAGGLYEPQTGLVRFGARDYDPTSGRWIAKDPVRFDGGNNLYVYAGSDPINRTDPNGQFWGDGDGFQCVPPDCMNFPPPGPDHGTPAPPPCPKPHATCPSTGSGNGVCGADLSTKCTYQCAGQPAQKVKIPVGAQNDGYQCQYPGQPIDSSKTCPPLWNVP
jgi:RHS repeat-associated protein